MKNHTKTQSKKSSKSDPSNDHSTSDDIARSTSDACTSIELFGKVRFLRQNLDEDIDCIILSDGVEVHFPPQKGVEVTENINQGDEVRIVAYQFVTSDGDKHVHVELIENLQSGVSIYMQAPDERKNTKHHKEKHSQGHDAKHKSHERHHEHEQMLAEIAAIRSLVHSSERQTGESHLSSHEQILEELRELRQQLELRV